MGLRRTIDYALAVRLSLEAAAKGGNYGAVADLLGCSRERIRQILEAEGVLQKYHELKDGYAAGLLQHLKEML